MAATTYDVGDAFDQLGFGRFQKVLLFVTGFAFAVRDPSGDLAKARVCGG